METRAEQAAGIILWVFFFLSLQVFVFFFSIPLTAEQ